MADEAVRAVQKWLNKTYGSVPGFVAAPENGQTGWPTIYSLRMGLQHEAGISAIGEGFGDTTKNALAPIVGKLKAGYKGNIAQLIQGAFWCKGINPGSEFNQNFSVLTAKSKPRYSGVYKGVKTSCQNQEGETVMIYGYARVSTAGQDLHEQIQELRAAGAQKVFSEKYTGTTTKRPVFSSLTATLAPDDVLMVTKLDRLARNTREALNVVNALLTHNIKIQVINLGQTFAIDATTGRQNSMTKMLMTIMLAYSDMERDMIIERTQAGKAYAKVHNPNFHDGRPRAATGQRLEAIRMYVKTHTAKDTAATYGVSESTVYRIKRRDKAAKQLENTRDAKNPVISNAVNNR